MDARSFTKRWIIGDLSLRRFLTSALFVYLSLLLFGLLFSERMIFRPPASSYDDRPNAIKLATSDGESISAVYLPNPRASHVVLFSHGNAEDLGMVREDLEQLRDLGFAVFAYDYRGYGTSGGRPGEAESYRDIDAAYEHVSHVLKLPPRRIIAYGRSLGGGPSVDLALRRELGGLVLESTFASAFRVVTTWPLFPFDRFRNADKLGKVRCPVLIMHGTADRVVAYRHAKMLLQAANEPKRLWTVEAGGHLTLMSDPGYAEALLSFERSLTPEQSEH